jgi:hypothetical protein
MAEDFGDPTDDLQRILRLTAPGFDPDDLRKVEEGFRNQNLVTPSKMIYWNGGVLNKEKVELPEIAPLMTKMAETSEVQPDNANHRQIVFEVISMSQSFAKESAAQAIHGPDKKTGADAERLQSAEYTKFAAQFGFIPALDQQIPPEQMSELRDKMLFNGTAELTVMLRMKNETANSAMKEKRTSLRAIGELVVESVDSEEASRNGQILARMLTLLIALCAVGCRPMAQGQGMMSDNGVVGQADGTTSVVYFHWNEAILPFSLTVKASANYGPSDLKKMWEFHWVTANESVNESGGSTNLSSAVNASVKDAVHKIVELGAGISDWRRERMSALDQVSSSLLPLLSLILSHCPSRLAWVGDGHAHPALACVIIDALDLPCVQWPVITYMRGFPLLVMWKSPDCGSFALAPNSIALVQRSAQTRSQKRTMPIRRTSAARWRHPTRVQCPQVTPKPSLLRKPPGMPLLLKSMEKGPRRALCPSRPSSPCSAATLVSPGPSLVMRCVRVSKFAPWMMVPRNRQHDACRLFVPRSELPSGRCLQG